MTTTGDGGGAVERDVVPFRVWPPVALGAPLALGTAATLTWGDPVGLPSAAGWVGWLLVLVFGLWNGWALWLFRRRRTGLLPGQATTAVMVDGPFPVSRNPLYLGLVVLYVGLALLLPSVWALLLLPVGVAVLAWGAIRPEERYLRDRFGEEYAAYARRVRRWL
jgi:protein-S-isoprenylcysteine O-methyltransferase Ste14